jgi:magnesium transporter
MNNNIKEITNGSVRWLDVESPSRQDIEYLKTHFNLHPLDLEDVVAPTQRSKMEQRDDYIFLIMLFPVYNRKTGEIESSETDFFLTKNYLISIHHGDLSSIPDLFQLCVSSEQAKINYMNNSSQYILYNILNKLYQYCFPILDHVSIDILNSKKQIFMGKEKEMLEKILVIRRNITDMRKIMQSHKITLDKFLKNNIKINKQYLEYYDHLIDDTKEIWDQLEASKESIEALQDANESLISYKLNKVMKILTVISVGLMPASFVTNLFMMNSVYTPLVGIANDFWIIFGISAISSILLLIIIWHKKWL